MHHQPRYRLTLFWHLCIIVLMLVTASACASEPADDMVHPSLCNGSSHPGALPENRSLLAADGGALSLQSMRLVPVLSPATISADLAVGSGLSSHRLSLMHQSPSMNMPHHFLVILHL